ncbi:Cap15 family cyclic dinucleotide receptor domain-containing protein [Rhizobium sp. PAMB 3182]
MLTRTSISAYLVVAIVVWGGFLWWLNLDLTWDYAKPYSLTLAALTFVSWLFNQHLWRYWPFRLFAKVPDISGTWNTELQSSYKTPDSDMALPTVQGYAVIRQTYSTLSIRLMTAQSESLLVAGRFDRQPDGTTYVYGIYQSDPSILLRTGVSEIHYGSFKYKILGRPPVEMTGHYWTDRNTNGSVRLHSRRRNKFDSYSHASS